MDLCGHATLAAAHAVWDEGLADPKLPIRFSTLSGILTCRRNGAGEGWVEMDFPAEVGGWVGYVEAVGQGERSAGVSAAD